MLIRNGSIQDLKSHNPSNNVVCGAGVLLLVITFIKSVQCGNSKYI